MTDVLDRHGNVINNSLTYDVRSLDPNQLFRFKPLPTPKELENAFQERLAKLRQNATGIESFVYEVIPISLIRSFSQKLDPTRDFRLSPHKVSEVNRTRKRTADFPSTRKLVGKRTGGTYLSPIHYGGVTGKYGPKVFTPNPADGSGALSPNPPIWWLSKDTTKQSRPPWSNFGEFEKIKFRLYSPPRRAVADHIVKVSGTGSHGTIGWSNSEHDYRIYFGPTGARLSSNAHLDTILSSSSTYANSLMTQQGPQMLARALPTGRRYSLWRNITELKDLPRSVLSLRTSLGNFAALERSLFSAKDRADLLRRSAKSLKGLPNEWLSYWFGWQTIYRDVMDLMQAPSKTAKQVNYLLERDGKPTTHRIVRRWDDTLSATPLFSYEASGWITNLTTNGQHKRSTEIRCVINTSFRFPNVEVPLFKKDLVLSKLGVFPSLSDIYELMPWSWLVDWFTGAGNYLELVEAVNSDPSSFNYGFISVIVEGEFVTNASYRTTSLNSHMHNGVSLYSKNVIRNYNHSSILGYEYQLRKSVEAVTGKPTLTDVDSLSPWQKSILGALIFQRI